jgi:hypothetical protein
VGRLSAGTSAIFRCDFSQASSGKFQDNTLIIPRPLPTKLFPVRHSSLILLSDGNGAATDSVVKQPTIPFCKLKLNTSSENTLFHALTAVKTGHIVF